MHETKVLSLDELMTEIPADVQKYFENIEIEAGILQDALYKNGASLQQVASELEARYGWLEKATTTSQNDDLRNAINIVVGGFIGGRFSEQQFINAIAATMINPINRKEFGHNSPATKKRKGFDHVMVCTGKFIKSIKARLSKGVGDVS